MKYVPVRSCVRILKAFHDSNRPRLDDACAPSCEIILIRNRNLDRVAAAVFIRTPNSIIQPEKYILFPLCLVDSVWIRSRWSRDRIGNAPDLGKISIGIAYISGSFNNYFDIMTTPVVEVINAPSVAVSYLSANWRRELAIKKFEMWFSHVVNQWSDGARWLLQFLCNNIRAELKLTKQITMITSISAENRVPPVPPADWRFLRIIYDNLSCWKSKSYNVVISFRPIITKEVENTRLLQKRFRGELRKR